MLRLARVFVHNARMSDWSDDIHAVLLQLNGYMNRPDLDQAFLARAGVKLDRSLFPLLSRIGLYHPISVVELASLVGRNHSTVSRQSAKLEALGLVRRQTAKADQRVRLLEPSESGWRMLEQFAGARRQFVNRRLGDWKEEERAMLLDLLRRFSATIANIETTADASARSTGARSGKRVRP
jgi:DNA-binding MarR family transcriptional regulator